MDNQFGFVKGKLYVLPPGTGAQYPTSTWMRYTHFSKSQPRLCFKAVNNIVKGKRLEICLSPSKAHNVLSLAEHTARMQAIMDRHDAEVKKQKTYQFKVTTPDGKTRVFASITLASDVKIEEFVYKRPHV